MIKMQYLLVLLASLVSTTTAASKCDKNPFPNEPYDFPPPSDGACDYDTGPDRKTLWYYNQEFKQAGVLDPSTQQIHDFTISGQTAGTNTPYSVNGHEAQKCTVRTGKNGFVYMTDSNNRDVFKVDPKTYQYNIIRVLDTSPAGDDPGNTADAWAGQSALWVTNKGSNIIRRFDYHNDTYTNYIVCSSSPDCGVFGIREDSRGNIWFTEFYANKIGRLNPRTKQVTEWDIPQPAGSNPGSFRGATGRYFWANAFGGGGLIRVDTHNPRTPIKVYTYNPNSYPVQNDVDHCGNVWISSYNLNVLAYLNPRDGNWTTIAAEPASNAQNGDQTQLMHYGPANSMWYVNNGFRSIQQYKLSH